MKYLYVAIADYSWEIAHRKTKNLRSLLRTYSNLELTDIQLGGVLAGTLAFLIQISSKRLSSSKTEEKVLIEEALTGLKRVSQEDALANVTLEVAGSLINQFEDLLTKNPDINLANLFVNSITTCGIESSLAEDYLKDLIEAAEGLYDIIEKMKPQLEKDE